jgi:hypothetical protein
MTAPCTSIGTGSRRSKLKHTLQFRNSAPHIIRGSGRCQVQDACSTIWQLQKYLQLSSREQLTAELHATPSAAVPHSNDHFLDRMSALSHGNASTGLPA